MTTGHEEATLLAKSVLPELTLNQKIGQLNQRLLGWKCFERASGGWRPTRYLLEELERSEGLGGIYALMRADAWSGQSWESGIDPDSRLAVVDQLNSLVADFSPQGILPFISEEAPHGHQALGGTLLPTNHTMAAAWNPELVEEAAAAVAAELAASGANLALVSGLDMLRDPRWGRSEECFGESPELASQMTSAIVRGMQGIDRSKLGAGGVGVVLKHLAAQGEAIGGRNGQSAIIGPRDLDEIHLAPVRAGVSSGALSFMAAYNDIDGVPCCANPWLLTEYLRAQLGFDGFVMSDLYAIDRLETSTGSLQSAGVAALLAGVDLSLGDEAFTLLLRAAESDPVVEAAVDAACLRILEAKAQLGLLAGCQPAERPEFDPARTEALSLRLACDSLVLLTNDGSLPLGEDQDILVTGPFADDHHALLGDYVSPLAHENQHTVADALRGLHSGVRLETDPERSKLAARDADVVVAVVGSTSQRFYNDRFESNGAAAAANTLATCGEGVDVANISLPHGQDRWLRDLRDCIAGKLVTVVIAGRPQVLCEVTRLSDATLWAGYPGPQGAEAIARAVLGHTDVTGRLPFTLPSSSGVLPVRFNDRQTAHNVYRDVPDPVLFSFGHGLRYADLVEVALRADTRADGFEVRLEIRNRGHRSADLVAPVFVRRIGTDVVPRRSELLRFRRVEVAAEAIANVSWLLSREELLSGGTAVELTAFGSTLILP